MTAFIEWLSQPMVLLFLSVLTFFVTERLYQRYKVALVHPLVLGSLGLGLLLLPLGIQASAYEQANQFLIFLLSPAVVALALPLYRYRHTILKNQKLIYSLVFYGAIVSAAIAFYLAVAFEAEIETLRAVVAKSVTTPIAVELVRITGGNIPLIVAVVVFTGIFGAMVGPAILRWFGITDDKTVGLILGITSHGMGTVKSFEISPKAGAFASLGMALTGVVTAIGIGLYVFFV